MFEDLQVPAMSPAGDVPQEAQALLARHDELVAKAEATGLEEDRLVWVAWLSSLSPEAVTTLALDLGRRGLDKLGCAEVPV